MLLLLLVAVARCPRACVLPADDPVRLRRQSAREKERENKNENERDRKKVT